MSYYVTACKDLLYPSDNLKVDQIGIYTLVPYPQVLVEINQFCQYSTN